jgi:putative endonuclease
VASWYVREGYEILARNWRCPRGELDVVAWRGGVLVICEVKARRNNQLGDPFEAITPRKVLRLRRATAAFVHQLRGIGENSFRSSFFVKEIQFDAAAVIGASVVVRQQVV